MSRLQQLILYSAHNANILPLTSTCNVHCLFCSHGQNPPQLEVFRIPPRTLIEIEETLDFIDQDKKIVIGESVTRIIEGEPLTHPNFTEIMELIRQRFPRTTIQITTNGNLIDEGMANFLSSLEPIELNLSLNSSSLQQRKVIMQDKLAPAAINSVRLLADRQVTFHGSIVAMPHITGWEDLAETINFLDQGGAKTIRVFMPGYTKLASREAMFEPELWQKLMSFSIKQRNKISTPLIFEPCFINDLEAEVEGIISDSPAKAAGIFIGDKIISVDGEKCFSKVDAFQKILKGENPLLELERQGEGIKIKLTKEAFQGSGLVMSYDLDPIWVKEIPKQIRRSGASKVLFLTSPLAQNILIKAWQHLDLKETADILAVPSKFFGGTIMAAGLLVVEDYSLALDQYLANNDKPDLLILPAVAFDAQGRDLAGQSYLDMVEKYGINIILG